MQLNKKLGIGLVALFIIVLSTLNWHSNHQTIDINDNIKSNNTTNDRIEGTNKTNDRTTNNIKSIELEKPPFID